MEGITWVGRAEQAVGAALVLLVLVDVFFTVLFPASGHGPIRRPLSKATWRSFAGLARRMRHDARRRFLAYSGPVQIAVTILVWVAVLVVGWGLVFLPALGHAVSAAHGPTDTGFSTAVYYSGFTLTTLGTGDVVPATGAYRVLTVAEAAMGFSVVTMVLTYFLSIYSSLVSRKSFAVALDHSTFGTGVPVQLLVGLADDGALPQAQQEISRLGEFLSHTIETHRSYPVLRYFHFRRHRYALPRLLLIALESAALVRSALDGRRYRGLARSAAVYQLATSGLEALEELVPRVPPQEPSEDERVYWCRRFRACIAELERAGLDVTCDVDQGAQEYVALRRRWDAPLRSLSADMLYDWEKIDVMRP